MSFCNWDSRKRREPVRNNWEGRRSIKHTCSGKCRILPLLNFLISQVVVLNVEGKWLQRRDVLLHSACYYSTLNYLSFWPSPTSLHTCCCQDSWFWGADYYYLIIYSLRGKAFKGISWASNPWVNNQKHLCMRSQQLQRLYAYLLSLLVLIHILSLWQRFNRL